MGTMLLCTYKLQISHKKARFRVALPKVWLRFWSVRVLEPATYHCTVFTSAFWLLGAPRRLSDWIIRINNWPPC